MFGQESTHHRCRWVCDRLPLLDGGELIGSDRRKVESHLVVCRPCRVRREGLANALNVLRAAGAEAPSLSNTRADSASLWPALQRQIRETRHQPRNSAIAELLSWLDRPSSRFAALAATGLIAVAATWAGVDAWARSQVSTANAVATSASRPVPVRPPVPHSALDFAPIIANADADLSSRSPDRIPSRFGYDLDRGTVTNSSDAGQIKPSY